MDVISESGFNRLTAGCDRWDARPVFGVFFVAGVFMGARTGRLPFRRRLGQKFLSWSRRERSSGESVPVGWTKVVVACRRWRERTGALHGRNGLLMIDNRKPRHFKAFRANESGCQSDATGAGDGLSKSVAIRSKSACRPAPRTGDDPAPRTEGARTFTMEERLFVLMAEV